LESTNERGGGGQNEEKSKNSSKGEKILQIKD